MYKPESQKLMEIIAKQHGVSVEEVAEEIQAAIKNAYDEIMDFYTKLL